MDKQKPKTLVSAEQNKQIERAVVAWVNSWPSKPIKAEYGFLGKTSGLAVATIQSAYKIAKYITGGYKAQYQFEIAYRLTPANTDERLAADELLNTLGEWMEQNKPAPPAGVNWRKINHVNGAAHINSYENGAEDHAIQMTLIYEVI